MSARLDQLFLLSILTGSGCLREPFEPPEQGGSTGGETGPSAETLGADGSMMPTDADSTEGPDGTTSGAMVGGSSSGSVASTGDDRETSTTSDGTSTTADAEPDPDAVAACTVYDDALDECFGGPVHNRQHCNNQVGYLEAFFPTCIDAHIDIWSCLSTVDCASLDMWYPAACADEFLAAHALCPDFVPYCQGGGPPGGGLCDLAAEACIDGHTYALICGTQTCDCIIDDVVVETMLYDADSCSSEACGFPDVFGG